LRERVLTPEGLETTFAVNVLAPYRITCALASLLRPPRRLVNVVSIARFSTGS
jgi:NAD(P)-dependent dehydrogenase (short-subunit alcohol dehydrogenase family)